MEQFTGTIDTVETRQEYARVVDKTEGLFTVETNERVYQVKRAFSCLVEPQPEDIVLISVRDLEPGYILAVLEREIPDKTTIVFNGDVDLKTEQGRIGISAKHGLDLACAQEINLTSQELNCSAGKSSITIGSLSFWGTVIEAHLDRIKTIVDHVESFVKLFFQKSGQSYRFVDQIDQVKSNRISYEAEKTLQLRGTFAQMTAKEDIHIDGQRINIG